MYKRLFDILVAGIALVVLFIPMLLIALVIKLTSKGPVLYCARRSGLNGKEFTMYKFRTMHILSDDKQSRITSAEDPRVFAFGNILRASKLDELPQLFNVLKGDMSIVGPRPEDPIIVDQHYSENDRKTLMVRPGLASPGSLYNYTHGNKLIGNQDPESDYVNKLLPVKLALERVYIERAGILYDFRIILRTIIVILKIILGKDEHDEPEEMTRALQIMQQDNMNKN